MIRNSELGVESVAEFRRLLDGARRDLLRTAAVTEDEMQGLAEHEPGAFIEDSARRTAVDVLARLEDRERDELDEIQAAEARLDAGTFGACETCGRPIPVARLHAMPWARHCLGCQARTEGRR